MHGVIKMCLRKMRDDAVLQNGDTALLVALQHGRTECARLLLEYAADKNVKNLVRNS